MRSSDQAHQTARSSRATVRSARLVGCGQRPRCVHSVEFCVRLIVPLQIQPTATVRDQVVAFTAGIYLPSA